MRNSVVNSDCEGEEELKEYVLDHHEDFHYQLIVLHQVLWL